MTIYYVDDGGSNTAPYDTWAKAATSLLALTAAITPRFDFGDIIYIGHDHVDPATYTGTFYIEAWSFGNPVIFMSATQGSDPPVYQKAVSNQINMTGYNLQLSGAMTFLGLQIHIRFLNPTLHKGHRYHWRDCRISFTDGARLNPGLAGEIEFESCEFDFSADTSASSAVPLGLAGTDARSIFRDCVVTGGDQRTGTLFAGAPPGTTFPTLTAAGIDVTSLTNATLCEVVNAYTVGIARLSNLLTAATWAPWPTGTVDSFTDVSFVNCGSANAPTFLMQKTGPGDLISTTDIYRDGGAEMDGTPFAWLVMTNDGGFYPDYFIDVGLELRLPWIYGTTEAGTRTFTVHITNDAGDLTDWDIYLEVEFLSVAGTPLTSLATDSAPGVSSTTAQTDDTSSTWTGTGPSFTYKQKLEVTAAVAEDGLYRARVCLRKASIASSAYLYVDPMIEVA